MILFVRAHFPQNTWGYCVGDFFVTILKKVWTFLCHVTFSSSFNLKTIAFCDVMYDFIHLYEKKFNYCKNQLLKIFITYWDVVIFSCCCSHLLKKQRIALSFIFYFVKVLGMLAFGFGKSHIFFFAQYFDGLKLKW